MNRLALILLQNIFRLPGAYAKLCRYAKNPERYGEQQTWDHIRKVLKMVARSGNIDLQVSGVENIPQKGGFMLYGNHQGLFDVVAIGSSCPRPLGAVYKIELANTPVLKQIYACTKSFGMDRDDVRQSLTVIQNVTEEVKNGRSYLIFPEGTRSKNGNVMGEFHGGSFRCAIKAKCPIVPFALIDSGKVLDQKGSAPVKVQLHYLKPIPYEEYKDLKSVALAQLVKDRIQAAIDENT